jgi:uracil phosphoribosyltransferase
MSKGVDEGKILFLSLIAAPEGIHMVCRKFPRVKVITSEIDEGIDESTFQVVPGETFVPEAALKLTVQYDGSDKLWRQHYLY